jgi:hypothetical protein
VYSHPVLVPEGFRAGQDEIRTVRDVPADVVRQTAVGKGHVVSGFQDGDLGLAVYTAGPGGGGGSGGNPADDQDFLYFAMGYGTHFNS